MGVSRGERRAALPVARPTDILPLYVEEAAMPSLSIVSGPNEGDYYPLGSRTMVVGRDEACPVQITDDRVSRKHLQIRCDQGRYLATDLKSANGLRINGRDVQGECELEDGDVIEIGRSKIAFWAREFDDRESAMSHWHERGHRTRPTIQD